YGDKAPKSIIARILCIIWMLAGAILLSLFTANTTSIITASRIGKNSQTMGKKIGVVNMKQFVQAELNLGAHIIEYTKVEAALEALNDKSIDRLLFPHYLDLLFFMSDPNLGMPVLSNIYIAKELDKSFQIGMVLSHGNGSLLSNQDFYTCLEIMTSRISSE
ncbi:Potassium voltage-gated channel subfamily F member 1, partial [Paramuricea clavata]